MNRTFAQRALDYVNRKFPRGGYKVRIGRFQVGHRFPCFVIAEIGINHNGSLEIAKKLIDVAAEAGCQGVKFQKRTVPVVYTPEKLAKPRAVPREVLETAIARGALPEENVERLKKIDFKETTDSDLKYALEFSENEYRQLFGYAYSKGLAAFASPWDEESVDVLERLEVPCYKIASASITDLDLLRKIKKTKKPIILSTGMATMSQVTEAMKIFGDREIIVLHTVSTYPAADEDLNLEVIQTLRRAFPKVPVGYSGHEQGIIHSVSAVAMGACVVERHVTLDRTMFGSDQAASLEPQELKDMVAGIRRLEKGKGSPEKRVVDGEIPIMQKLRRK